MKKIFVNLSDDKKGKYITTNNQCIWMETEDSVKLLSYYPNLDVNPKNIYKKSITIDKKFIREDGTLKKKDYDSNNTEIIGNFVEKKK